MANLIPSKKKRVFTVTVTIANGQTVSTAADLRGSLLAGIVFPGTFTGATVGLQVSPDDGANYYDVTDADGNAVSITATDGDYVPLADILHAVGTHVKVVSAGAEGGDRTVTLVCYEPVD